MHCILEGLAQTHFREVLCLTMASASSPPPMVKAFTHDFTPVDPGNPNMTPKEIKQVGEIHALLMAPAEDDDGDDWKKLNVKLLRKNTKAITFVCNSLQILPARFPQRCFKKDWVKALVCWVSD